MSEGGAHSRLSRKQVNNLFCLARPTAPRPEKAEPTVIRCYRCPITRSYYLKAHLGRKRFRRVPKSKDFVPLLSTGGKGQFSKFLRLERRTHYKPIGGLLFGHTRHLFLAGWLTTRRWGYRSGPSPSPHLFNGVTNSRASRIFTWAAIELDDRHAGFVAFGC